MKFEFFLHCIMTVLLFSACISAEKKKNNRRGHRKPITDQSCKDTQGNQYSHEQEWNGLYSVNSTVDGICNAQQLACTCSQSQISCRNANLEPPVFCGVDIGLNPSSKPNQTVPVENAFDSEKLCQPGAQASERLQHKSSCKSLGQSYGQLSVSPLPRDPKRPTPPPPEKHADLNIFVRGFDCLPKQAELGGLDPRLATKEDLRNFSFLTAWDAMAPRIQTMFQPVRPGEFANLYSTNNWNWQLNNEWGGRSTGLNGAVEVGGLKTTKGEHIHVPSSGYNIGGGYEVVVLYATPSTITLKYTTEDNIVHGYGLHFTGICVDPALVSKFESLKNGNQRPALKVRQAFGYALGNEVQVSVRDTGSFMDVTSRFNWFQEDTFDK